MCDPHRKQFVWNLNRISLAAFKVQTNLKLASVVQGVGSVGAKLWWQIGKYVTQCNAICNVVKCSAVQYNVMY